MANTCARPSPCSRTSDLAFDNTVGGVCILVWPKVRRKRHGANSISHFLDLLGRALGFAFHLVCFALGLSRKLARLAGCLAAELLCLACGLASFYVSGGLLDLAADTGCGNGKKKVKYVSVIKKPDIWPPLDHVPAMSMPSTSLSLTARSAFFRTSLADSVTLLWKVVVVLNADLGTVSVTAVRETVAKRRTATSDRKDMMGDMLCRGGGRGRYEASVFRLLFSTNDQTASRGCLGLRTM